MNLNRYFEQHEGHGVLATADATGKVNVALYARPHFVDNDVVVFIMAEKLTYKNLQSNPWATYFFIEEGKGYKGKRLYLQKLKEEQNEQLTNEIRRRCDYSHYQKGIRSLVYFRIENTLPLIGDNEKTS
jgi:hypothetical protein